MTGFQLISEIRSVATIAEGNAIRDLPRLIKSYGVGRWRKRKGTAIIELGSGQQRVAEIHWYEAHGIGRKEMKIKRLKERG